MSWTKEDSDLLSKQRLAAVEMIRQSNDPDQKLFADLLEHSNIEEWIHSTLYGEADANPLALADIVTRHFLNNIMNIANSVKDEARDQFKALVGVMLLSGLSKMGVGKVREVKRGETITVGDELSDAIDDAVSSVPGGSVFKMPGSGSIN